MNSFKKYRLSGYITRAKGKFLSFYYYNPYLIYIDNKFKPTKRQNYSGNSNLNFLLDKRLTLSSQRKKLKFFQIAEIFKINSLIENADEDISNTIMLEKNNDLHCKFISEFLNFYNYNNLRLKKTTKKNLTKFFEKNYQNFDLIFLLYISSNQSRNLGLISVQLRNILDFEIREKLKRLHLENKIELNKLYNSIKDNEILFHIGDFYDIDASPNIQSFFNEVFDRRIKYLNFFESLDLFNFIYLMKYTFMEKSIDKFNSNFYDILEKKENLKQIGKDIYLDNLNKDLNYNLFERINLFLFLLNKNEISFDKKILKKFYFLGILYIEGKNNINKDNDIKINNNKNKSNNNNSDLYSNSAFSLSEKKMDIDSKYDLIFEEKYKDLISEDFIEKIDIKSLMENGILFQNLIQELLEKEKNNNKDKGDSISNNKGRNIKVKDLISNSISRLFKYKRMKKSFLDMIIIFDILAKNNSLTNYLNIMDYLRLNRLLRLFIYFFNYTHNIRINFLMKLDLINNLNDIEKNIPDTEKIKKRIIRNLKVISFFEFNKEYINSKKYIDNTLNLKENREFDFNDIKFILIKFYEAFVNLYEKDPTNKSYECLGKILINDFVIYSNKNIFNKKENDYIMKLFKVNQGVLFENKKYYFYE
jgi:hypothetical protein